MLRFNGYRALKTVYPEYEWETYKFAQCPKGYLYDKNNLAKRIEYIGKSIGVQTLEDWHFIPFNTGLLSMIYELIDDCSV